MMLASLGDPSRPAHQEILEEEQAQLDHAHDIFLDVAALWRLRRQTLTKISSLMGLR